MMRTALILGYVGLLIWAIQESLLPLKFVLAPVTMSLFAYLAYAVDKRAARKEGWRIPEANLHLLELLCGWPGALLAQRVLRHKTRKTRYRVVFWMMVLLNLGATLAWIYWKS